MVLKPKLMISLARTQILLDITLGLCQFRILQAMGGRNFAGVIALILCARQPVGGERFYLLEQVRGRLLHVIDAKWRETEWETFPSPYF